MADVSDRTEHGLMDINTLIRSMESVMIDQQGGPSEEIDEISCLTEYSMPLSDIYEVGDNDVVFSRPSDHAINSSHSGNRLFRRMINDYKQLYHSAVEEEDKEVVVAEVVRIWRSREPPGRFLESTESATPYYPLHDIGDDRAKRRTSKLLIGGNYSNAKHRDDVTASTAGSSTVTHREQSTSTAIRPRQAAPGERFGGSFRGLILSLFSSNKDSIMNQYLP